MDDELTIRTVRDLPTASVELHGLLRVEHDVLVRNALRKHVADQPAALIVDLANARLADPAALTMLRSALCAAAAMPSIPVVLLVPDADLAELMRRAGCAALAPIARDRVVALAYAARHRAPPYETLRGLAPDPSVLRLVRRAATDACEDWGISQCSASVELVASELVTNAIEHARTRCDATIALRGRQVQIAVRDGSPFPPRRDGSAAPGRRGLIVVDGLATAWGSLPDDGGKLVWATIAVERRIDVDGDAYVRYLRH